MKRISASLIFTMLLLKQIPGSCRNVKRWSGYWAMQYIDCAESAKAKHSPASQRGGQGVGLSTCRLIHRGGREENGLSFFCMHDGSASTSVAMMVAVDLSCAAVHLNECW